MTVFSYAGLVDVHVGPELENYQSVLRRELLESPGGAEARMVVRTAGPEEDLHRPLRLIGGLAGISRRGDFLCSDGRGHYCRFDIGHLGVSYSLDLEFTVCCPRFSVNVLLEWLVVPAALFATAAHGHAPLHASGVVWNGSTSAAVFGAWAGVGKTTLVLAALREQIHGGRHYLGDDIVLVDGDGMALPSSRTVSAYPYNRRLLSGLKRSEYAKLAVANLVRTAALRYPRPFGRLREPAIYASNAWGNLRVEVPRARTVSDTASVPVTAHVRCLSASESNAGGLRRLESWDPKEEAEAHLAVLDYELARVQRYAQAWRWSTQATSDPWEAIRHRWRGILVGYFSAVPNHYELSLPQTRTSPALLEEVLTELGRLGRPA